LTLPREGGPQGPEGQAASATRLTIEELYRAHALAVARWASRLGGRELDVEDVLQDVFIIAQRQLGSFRGDSKITTWLFGITRNVVRSRMERERVRRFFLSGLAPFMETQSADGAQLERVERRQSLELVYRALEGLPERYRTAFVLFELEGLSGEEAAELTGMKVSTLRVNLMRARAKFTERMGRLLRQPGETRR